MQINRHVLTNAHVVKGCKRLTSSRETKPVSLEVIAVDSENDLAVIKGDFSVPAAVVFADERTATLGENVLAAGFPLRGVLSDDLRVTLER